MNARAVLLIASAAALGAAPNSWSPPRAADGHPDLQGIWTNATLTPLERPRDLANKEFLSEQEAEAFAQRALHDADGDRRDGGSGADVNRAYNEFWRDRGKVVPSRRTSLITDTPDGRIPALTAEGKARAAARAEARRLHPFDGPEDRSPAERCLATPNAGPPMMPANYNANYQIVQAPGYVAILSEQIHDVRVIPTDGSPHLPATIRQWMGDSRGHWEGGTLVVDTTNFTDQTAFAGSGPQLHLVERFTRTDANTLLYEFRVEDPATFTRPWIVQIPMTKAPGPLFEYACHEGNYGMFGMLSGARAEEKGR